MSATEGAEKRRKRTMIHFRPNIKISVQHQKPSEDYVCRITINDELHDKLSNNSFQDLMEALDKSLRSDLKLTKADALDVVEILIAQRDIQKKLRPWSEPSCRVQFFIAT